MPSMNSLPPVDWKKQQAKEKENINRLKDEFLRSPEAVAVFAALSKTYVIGFSQTCKANLHSKAIRKGGEYNHEVQTSTGWACRAAKLITNPLCVRPFVCWHGKLQL